MASGPSASRRCGTSHRTHCTRARSSAWMRSFLDRYCFSTDATMKARRAGGLTSALKSDAPPGLFDLPRLGGAGARDRRYDAGYDDLLLGRPSQPRTRPYWITWIAALMSMQLFCSEVP